MKSLKHIVIRWLTRGMLRAIHEDDILQITPAGVYLHKRKLTGEEVSILKSEAKFFATSQIWKLMSGEVELIAQLTMFEKSKSDEDLKWGKAMIYNLFLLRGFLDRLNKL